MIRDFTSKKLFHRDLPKYIKMYEQGCLLQPFIEITQIYHSRGIDRQISLVQTLKYRTAFKRMI